VLGKDIRLARRGELAPGIRTMWYSVYSVREGVNEWVKQNEAGEART
jgi:hypothetical protein